MTFNRITANAKVCGDSACVKGTRVPVHVVLDFLGAGDSIDELLEGFPQLTRADVLACIGYAADLVRDGET